MSIGVIGRKVGMTQVFAEDGTIVPVSVLAVEPNTVTGLKTKERDGYTAVQLGAGTARRLSKPRLGQLQGLPRVRDTREFRMEDTSQYEVGQTLGVDLFTAGDSEARPRRSSAPPMIPTFLRSPRISSDIGL